MGKKRPYLKLVSAHFYMPKHSTEFDHELTHLFHMRIDNLRSDIWKNKPGLPAELPRKRLDDGIKKLQGIVEKALSNKCFEEEIKSHGVEKSRWRIRGRGRDKKIQIFKAWYNKEIGNKECVYAIYGSKPKKCWYVGSTGKSGGGRPGNHFTEYWFPQNGSIRIFYGVQKSRVLCLEGLAIHTFKPTVNNNNPGKKKCPICAKQKRIENELRRIFRIKHFKKR